MQLLLAICRRQLYILQLCFGYQCLLDFKLPPCSHFFWIIPRRLNFICRRFGTLYLFQLHRQVHLPVYKVGTVCSETSEYKIQTPRNYPEESIKYSEQGESLNSNQHLSKTKNRLLLNTYLLTVRNYLTYILQQCTKLVVQKGYKII